MTAGRPIGHSHEAVVDSRVPVSIGGSFTIAGVSLTVVGTVRDRTLLAGQPDVYVSLRDAQRILYGGKPLMRR